MTPATPKDGRDGLSNVKQTPDSVDLGKGDVNCMNLSKDNTVGRER